jgi:TonB family protein
MTLTSYLLQVSIYLILFYAFYEIVLKRQTFFTLNRICLINAVIFSLTIPLLSAGWQPHREVVQQSLSISIQYALESAQTFQQVTSSLSSIITPTYITGVAFSSVFFIWRLTGLKKAAVKMSKNKAFSFFKFKAIDKNLLDYHVINVHEQVHVRQFHSLDVLFFEIAAILFWFNPVIYFYKRRIKQVHEHLADRAAAQYMGDKKSYALLLLHNSLGLSPVLANSFQNTSLLKSRIYMLQREQSRKLTLLRYILIVPMILVMFLFSTANISPKESSFKTDAPAFPGGLKSFQSYLINAVNTSKTLNHKSQGKVLVSFMIDTDGAVTQIKILESTNTTLNKEAITIMEACPKWLPGYENGVPIKVQYQINLRFQSDK